MYTIENFRECLAEQSDSGFLIAADYCEEQSDNPRMQSLCTVLRRYVDIQTYVRMSQPIPVEMAEEFKAANNSFETPERRPLEVGDGEFFEPLGPFYIGLRVGMFQLANNLNLLSIEPVRRLQIWGCEPGNDLALILRNYRMAYMTTLQMQFYNGNATELAQNILNMKGHMLQRLTISGLDDRLKQVESAFRAAKEIRQGAELFISARRYNQPERVAVKRV